MKKMLCSLILAFSILLCGCENQSQQQDSANSTTSTTTPAPANSDTTTQTDTKEETTTTSEASDEVADEPIEYDYSLTASFCDAVNVSAVYMNSIIQYYYSYADIMDWSADDDIESGLSFALSAVIGDDDSGSQILQSLDTAYEGLTVIGDPDLVPLLKDCLDDYKALSELVNNPTGTCGEYLTSLTFSYNYLIDSHNAAIEYMYNIGYYSDEELEAARIRIETDAAG